MKLLFITSILISFSCFFSCGMAPPKTASSSPIPNTDWHLFTPPEKTFSAEFPCEPTQENGPRNEYSCDLLDAGGLRIFSVSVWKSDFEGARIRDEAAFERSVKESFTPNHTIVNMTPIKIDGGLGREVIVSNRRDNMDNLRGRVIIFGTHRFEVAYIATDKKLLESPQADRFFAGFKPLR